MKIAREAVESMMAEIEVGKIYRGKVVTIKEFGCFVEVFPGKDGSCTSANWPTSAQTDGRTSSRSADEIWVKCIASTTKPGKTVAQGRHGRTRQTMGKKVEDALFGRLRLVRIRLASRQTAVRPAIQPVLI